MPSRRKRRELRNKNRKAWLKKIDGRIVSMNIRKGFGYARTNAMIGKDFLPCLAEAGNNEVKLYYSPTRFVPITFKNREMVSYLDTNEDQLIATWILEKLRR